MKYLLRIDAEGTIESFDERPTQDSIRNRGVGNYTLCRDDGQVLKEFIVTLNRNSNLTIVGSTPRSLNGMSTLNLERLVKYYERIVKIWPEQNRAVNQVVKELEQRAALVKLAA